MDKTRQLLAVVPSVQSHRLCSQINFHTFKHSKLDKLKSFVTLCAKKPTIDNVHFWYLLFNLFSTFAWQLFRALGMKEESPPRRDDLMPCGNLSEKTRLLLTVPGRGLDKCFAKTSDIQHQAYSSLILTKNKPLRRVHSKLQICSS